MAVDDVHHDVHVDAGGILDGEAAILLLIFK